MTRGQWMAAACVLAVGMAGCGRGPQGPENQAGLATGAGPGKPVVVQRLNLEGATVTATGEAGRVTGNVRWDGPAEAPADGPAGGERTVRIDGQPRPAQLNPPLRINAANQGIADAVVWIEKAPPGSTVESSGTCRLTQKNGDFHPRVQAVPLGGPLQLSTADDQADFQASGAINFNLPVARGSTPPTRPLTRSGLVEVRSQAHPWMAAFIWVFDHPYFAVTDADGSFRLKELPPGEYQLKMWHPSWRNNGAAAQKQATVRVGANEGAAVQFTLTGSDGR